ncbi:MAG: MBL fold metallo-hydrolase [Gammaproteobacteria bacterium]|nr:MBL fold metallo-hydrolase [Gammaproteobacteria bacterium]
MIFRQLFDQDSSTYTYLLADKDSGEAVIIDSVFEQCRRDRALLKELNLELKHVIDTHCHADHVTASWLMSQHTGAKIGVSANADVAGADNYFKHGDEIRFGARYLQARSTPGHTNGCMTYVLDDESMAFTGDALLIRGCGRTDFQQGDAHTLYKSIHENIFTLPDSSQIYPGHDYRGLMSSTVKEEKKYNSRLGGNVSAEDFSGYMDNLGLAHPRKLDIAVPANLKSGRPENGELPESEPQWAPLSFTFGGIWEIDANWLVDNLKAVQVVDVREQEEFDGPLGHIADAILVPLRTLKEKLQDLDTKKPVIAVCRSGARSAQATNIMSQAGLANVANLHGGMLHWNDLGLPVAGNSLDPDFQI